MLKKRFLALGIVLSLVACLRADEKKTGVAKTYHVPYRRTPTQHVLVRAKINGKGPFNFIVDTGAPALFLSKEVAKGLGIAPDKNGWGTFERFEIEGGVVIPKAKGRIEKLFQLEGMNGLGLAGATLHGVLGYNILAKFKVEFDFTKDKLTWTRLDFEPPPPKGLGIQGGAPAGLDALGDMMKIFGAMLGKRVKPGVIGRGFIGVELADKEDVVEVTAVLPKSPGAAAGLKPGDRIDRFQGTKVDTPAELLKLAARIVPGDEIELTILRGSESKTFTFKAGQGL